MTTRPYNLSDLFKMAWQFVKRNGMNMSEALRIAWRNIKLKKEMHFRIVKFYYQKIDGTTREAYGTLKAGLVPQTLGTGRKQSPTVQTYFDTEKGEWRCFKIANLINVAL